MSYGYSGTPGQDGAKAKQVHKLMDIGFWNDLAA